MQDFRSFLIMPGNNPGMLIKSRAYTADAMIFDLEDAVAPPEKDAARDLVAETMKAIDFGEKPIMVRINPLDVCGKEDLARIIPCRPVAIFLPKVESAAMVQEAIAEIEKYEAKGQEPTRLFTIIESAKGMRNIFEIAESSPRMAGLAYGAEDYTASIGAVRTRESKEIFYGRSQIVVAARAAGIQSLDTVFVDIEDGEGLTEDANFSMEMGFTGKVCINPRQINLVNKVFSPTPELIRWAKRVVAAFEEAKENKSGVINLDGKMVDLPIVLQAEKIMKQAEQFNLI